MVRSKNFLLVGNANEKEIKQVGVRLNSFREASHVCFTGANVKSPVPDNCDRLQERYVLIGLSSQSLTSPATSSLVPDVNYITLTTEHRGVEQNTFNIIFMNTRTYWSSH